MRLLYTLIWLLFLPFALLRLYWRGAKEPGYRQHIAERLSLFPSYRAKPTIWLHAVSAGETRAAEPLIRALLAEYPHHHLVLSHMTATGRATAAQLLADLQERITQTWLPYDLPLFSRRFLQHYQPQCGILIETEVWPNLLASAQQLNLPMALVNARLSEKSLRKALRLPGLLLPAAQSLTAVAAQSHDDAARLQQLGVTSAGVTGNMKFDVQPPALAEIRGANWRRAFAERPVFLCASTREGEEALLLDALAEFLPLYPENLLVILTPRHPQRFDQVAQLLTQKQFRFVRRSEFDDNAELRISKDIQIILGDSMGEMYQYYAACDLAFIGGSLMPLGGHNLIEACAMGKPVLIAKHTFNFAEITTQAISGGAALRVDGARELLQVVEHLLAHPEKITSMNQAALTFFQQHQGATQRTLDILKPLLQVE